jgi:hypothetical protein
MRIMKDGSVLCDVCSGQLWPGAPYDNGYEDTVVELWPRWRYDPDYHVCIECFRREHEQRYLAQIKHMTASHKGARYDATRYGPGHLTPITAPGLTCCDMS